MTTLFRKVNERTECLLCPHNCAIMPGKTGICGVRRNTGESIELLTYGVVSGYALDPIEKKPLYHFYPGTNILSLGSYGCNMRCDFCQNYNISQHTLSSYSSSIESDMIIKDALSSLNNIGIAFTYNEPVIWFEFMRDVSVKAHKKGLRTVMVSNGFVNTEPLEEILTFIDAFNIDLKAFTNDFYRKLTGAELEPVKTALKLISASSRHLEITTLIIPGYNDSSEEMNQEAEWIAGELGKNVPLHLSRYFPMFRREDPSTPDVTLLRLFETASRHLDYVYLGNILTDKGQNTYCPSCGAMVAKRSGYTIKLQNLDQKGKCSACGTRIFRNFTSFSSSIRN
jgi:pyruvate formate lyase activating enzyme